MNVKTTCNQENGSMSELFGRECWVADGMLSLVISFVDDKEGELAKEVERYCEELRTKNRESYFRDVILD